VSAINASNIGKTIALIGWTPGDTAPDVTFQVQYKVHTSSTWVDAGTTQPATYTRQLTGLAGSTLYDVRVRQIRNGQFSAYTTADSLFTTLSTNLVPNPAGRDVFVYEVQVIGGKRYGLVKATFTAFLGDATKVSLYRSASSTFPGAGGYLASINPLLGISKGVTDPIPELDGSVLYYWLRTEAIDGSVVGTEQTCVPFPLTVDAA